MVLYVQLVFETVEVSAVFCVFLNSLMIFYVNNSLLEEHTHTQPFNGLWSGTTQVGQYQKKHSPTHTHRGQQLSTYSNQFEFWHPQLHQHLHPHSACHLGNKTYSLTPT